MLELAGKGEDAGDEATAGLGFGASFLSHAALKAPTAHTPSRPTMRAVFFIALPRRARLYPIFDSEVGSARLVEEVQHGSWSRARSLLAGSAGNLVEWYDWYSGERNAELLGAAAVFAVGFLMRPIGAWLMGVYAVRHGRKAALTLSVLLMCAGSMTIACTPGHARIGIASPAILVLARLLQGLSVGGEYGASATYLSEVAERSRRGFWSSLQYVTLIAGQLLALSVLIILRADARYEAAQPDRGGLNLRRRLATHHRIADHA